MNDKSLELCKILGIESRYIGYTDYKHDCPCGIRYVRKNYHELEDLLKDGTLKCINSNPIYPDFKKPENFVKLLKVSLSIEADLFFIGANPEEQLINDILNKSFNKTHPKRIILYQQQAQQTEWEY